MFSESRIEECRVAMGERLALSLMPVSRSLDVTGSWRAGIDGYASDAGHFDFFEDGSLIRRRKTAASPTKRYWRIVKPGLLIFVEDYANWLKTDTAANWQHVAVESVYIALLSPDSRLVLSNEDSSVAFVLTRI